MNNIVIIMKRSFMNYILTPHSCFSPFPVSLECPKWVQFVGLGQSLQVGRSKMKSKLKGTCHSEEISFPLPILIAEKFHLYRSSTIKTY